MRQEKINKLNELIQSNIDKCTYEYLSECLDFCLTNCDSKIWKSHITKQAFNYYNYFYDKHENGYFCSSCRSKVNKGLIKLKDLLLDTLSQLNTDDMREVCGESYGVISIIKLRSLMGL